MDPQALSAIASAVSMAVLVIAAAMDVRSREVRDGCWAAMFAVAAVCMVAGMLGSGTAASLAAAASVTLVAADLLWDREGGAVDAVLYVAIALSAVAAIVLSEGPARYAYVSFPVVYVLMLALYYAGVVRGGADAKAVIAVAASMPAYCPLADAIPLPAEPAVFMFPPAIAVLVLAAVMVMLLAPCFLIRNLVRGDWAFPQMLMGYRRSLPEDGAHLWSLDRAEDGKVVPGTSPWDDDDAFRRLRDAGADRVWVTPMVPFVLPIAAAFAIVWVWGNPLFLLI